MPSRDIYKVLGIGVADSVSILTCSLNFFIFSFCATPKCCSSSIIISPNLALDKSHEKIVMEEFYNHKIDLLISTSIIEAGLDIPNANTLIVYKSDYFGLAQLHQLRGRIGRSKIKGYAYFSVEKK